MFDYSNYKVYLVCGRTDMRKGINGLCEIGSFVWSELSVEESTMDISMEDFHNLIKAPEVRQKIKGQEVLKLRQKEKFGSSSEKADKNQMTLFDLFNEEETLREPIVVEPTQETMIPAHKREKGKRGDSFLTSSSRNHRVATGG